MAGDGMFRFYRYRPGDPPYRRTPAGRFEQYRAERGGWGGCNQDDRGLVRTGVEFLPNPVRRRAYDVAADAIAGEVR